MVENQVSKYLKSHFTGHWHCVLENLQRDFISLLQRNSTSDVNCWSESLGHQSALDCPQKRVNSGKALQPRTGKEQAPSYL